MDDLQREATASTPAVHLEAATGHGRIQGESYPPNAYEFFHPIVDWVRARLDAQGSISLELDLPYMNTSSVKWMLDLLDLLDQAYRDGREVNVRWRHDRENERAREVIEDFQEDLELPFQVEPY